MPIVIGLFIIPIIILIIKKSNSITTKKVHKILLNILLIFISIVYIICCLVIKAEPFNFKTTYSLLYMLYTGDFILNAGIVFMFTPFIWIIVVHFFKMIFRSIRVRKNANIKKDAEYEYYRDDLEKVSPGIVIFTSTLDIDMKKSISATILKLKLTDYIEEKEGYYIYTDKDESSLLESEKMVLNLIRFNDFDENKYKKIIKQEAVNNKYIVKNRGGILFRIIKMIIAICIPVIVCVGSIWLDQYTFDNYHIWPEDNGYAYVKLEKKRDIEKLNKEVKNKNDYYYSYMFDGSKSYRYDYIRADKLEYSVVRKAVLLNSFCAFIIGFISIFVLLSLYIIIEQIIYIKKSYRRTIKGKILLNKAYALKNYLKEYSLIKDRTEEELALWEYYLIYAVALDVNVGIEDKIIEKCYSSVQRIEMSCNG